MEEFNTKLTLKAENGRDVTIDILDIIDSYEFNKTFIIYTLVGGDSATVLASILNETDLEYSLDTITSQEEINYIDEQIKMFMVEEESIA